MSFGLILLVLSGLVSIGAWIWLIVVAFQNKETMWGALLIVSLFLPIGPIVAIVFLAMKWSIARRPGILLLITLGMAVIGTVIVVQAGRRTLEQAAQGISVTVNDAAVRRGERDGRAEPAVPPEADRVDPESEQPAVGGRPADNRRRPVDRATPRGISREEPGRPTAIETQRRRGESASVAGRETGTAASESASEVEPVRRRDPRIPPVTVRVLDLGDPRPNRMCSLRVQIGNPNDQAVTELKLDLEYLDHAGNRLGRWTTVQVTPEPIVAAQATNEFEMQAFFVPQFTRGVRFQIRGVEFEDKSRWPEGR